MTAGLTIIAVCSLCGHPYARWSGEAESAAHMAEAHGMRFLPGSLRPGDPPRWVRSLPATLADGAL